MGLKNSKVGWFSFVGGVTGYTTGMLMIWWMNAVDYPILVGGKPMFSPFIAFPPSYELTILFGAFGAILGMLFLNRLPRLHHPLLKHKRFALATHDKFFVVIETRRSEVFRNGNPQAARGRRQQAHRNGGGIMRYFLSHLRRSACWPRVVSAGRRGQPLPRNRPLQIFPDMKRQLKLRPQTPNGFFANGLSSQLPPPGTIAQERSRCWSADGSLSVRGRAGEHRPGHGHDQLRRVESASGHRRALLARGQQRFTIYCAPCHGQIGDGNGITKKIGAMAVVANLHDKRIVELADGELFNTVSHGKGHMQGYAADPGRGSLGVIAYLRALQLSRLGSVDDVPEAARGNLKK